MDPDLTHELQRHATALRGLARDLLRDPHAADDVTQATLHQAVVHRDRLQSGPVGGWLQRTLVNFARQWLRRERRQQQRVAALPTRADAPATDDVLARREMLQAVTHAVLALDEPYQTVIFLRDCEDLPPRAIARRTGANVATVKSRLARGLAMLRLRLDARCNGRDRWRAGLTFAFGLPLATPLLALPLAPLLVSTTPKVLLAAAAVAAVGLCVHGLGGDPTPAPAPTTPAPQPDGMSSSTAAEGAAGATDANVRIATSATPADDAWLAHPFTFSLDVFVVDSSGLPVAGHVLELSPTGCSRNRVQVATGPDGHALLTWNGRQRDLAVELQEPFGQLRRVQLQHGATTRCTLLGRGSGGNPVRVAISSKAGSDGTISVLATETPTTRTGVPVLSEIPMLRNFFVNGDSDATMRPGLHPFAVFAHAAAAAVPETVDQATSATEFAIHSLASGLRLELGSRILPLEVTTATAAPPPTTVAGNVFDATGKPAKNVQVALLGSDPQPLQRVQTDEQGRFRFESVAPGSFTLRAGGNALGLATAPVTVTTGTTPATLNLQTGQCVRGRVVTTDGRPRPKTNVQWRSLDGTWADLERSGDDGSFTFANLPSGPGMLVAFDADLPHRLPIGRVPSVLPDTNDVLVTCAPDTSSLQFEPVGDPATSSPVVEACLFDVETGLGTLLRNGKQNSPVWTCDKIPPGHYALHLRTAHSGSVVRDALWVDGKLPCDAGRIELPRHALVQIDLAGVPLPPQDQRAFEIDVLRPDLDLRLEQVQAPFTRPLQMPAGDYVFTFRHADGQLRFDRFTARAGETTTVRPRP
ncbi:MAG: sigma-70 family RNA polymerase sigma factor [Planctomycetes bacterium]|nr:sigma-70 family RNA polymerase sigma factor [Planctomycetota bacterium]